MELEVALGSNEPARKAKILVVDDQPIQIQLIYQILANDYQVFMATSGQKALEFCRNTPPDLILLDAQMPDMDGLETCRRLKKQETLFDIPVIFILSAEQQEEEQHCWQVGGSDFILQPINHATLKNRIKAQLTLKAQNRYLKQLAFIDGLTSLWNRRFADDYLQRQLSLVQRQELSLGLMMIDIDFFKQYNDHFGHLKGDDCLKLVSQTLLTCLKRPSDILARFGGEEFICVLPGIKLNDVAAIAQSMVHALMEAALPHPMSSYRYVTISIGIASTETTNALDADALIAAADHALYQAKAQGRCKVVAATSTDLTGTSSDVSAIN